MNLPPVISSLFGFTKTPENIRRLNENIRRLKRESFDEILTKGPPVFTPPKSRGQLVLDEALAQLKLGVKEPTKLFKNGASNIDGYIRTTGLQWETADAITWKKFAAYIRNGMFQWCGAFAAHCYAAAGLKLDIRRFFFPSATRLYDRGPKGVWAGEVDNTFLRPLRILQEDDMNDIDRIYVGPGDLLVMGYVRNGKPVPSHIGLAYKYSPRSTNGNMLLTIEGNAHGYSFGWDERGFKAETQYEGVVMQERKLFPDEGEYGILRVIRPIEKDYDN